MCIKFFEVFFIVLSSVFIIQMSLLNFCVIQNMNPMKVSHFVSFSVGTILFYVIDSLILAGMSNGMSKIIMFLLAFCPFVIGKIAKYQIYKKIALIQNIIILCGMIYVGNLLILH